MISPHKKYGTYLARTHWTVSLMDGFDGLRSCVIFFKMWLHFQDSIAALHPLQ